MSSVLSCIWHRLAVNTCADALKKNSCLKVVKLLGINYLKKVVKLFTELAEENVVKLFV